MKKKILLAVLMVAMLVCLFAVSISASDLAYDRVYTINGTEYPLWEQDTEGNYHPLMWYQDGDKLSKVWADNTDSTKAPYVTYSAYTSGTSREMQNFNITDASGNTFNGKATVVIANLHNVYVKAGDNAQITHIHKNAFNSSAVLKAVYIPESIVYMGWTNNDNLVSFSGCKALEYAEIAPSATITSIDCNTFLNCTSLKAVSLPDSITKLNHTSFLGCTSLQAVYLSRNLETFVYNGWNKGAFYNCTSLYFVNEPFIIENVATDIPKKPDVYYFPANLSSLGDSIRGCLSINDTLVFGDKLLVVDGTVFTGTGAKGEVKTAVFTGNLTKFYLGEGIDITWNFVFTDTTDESVFSARTDRGFGNSYAFLCKANRKCKFHYGVAWEDDTTHFAEAKKTQTVDATCDTNKTVTTYCFCGILIGTSELENTKLGHDYDVANGATKLSVAYENYLAKGILKTQCARCDDTEDSEAAPIVSDFKGYSIKEKGDGITFGYTLDLDALALYNDVNATDLEFGFVVAVKAFVQGDAPLKTDGSVADVTQGSVIKAAVSSLSYTGADFKLSGVWDGTTDINGVETNLKDVEFYMAGYVYDGSTVSYIDNEETTDDTASTVTYTWLHKPE